jgi:DNA-binding NarL/FixJ family response regulator
MWFPRIAWTAHAARSRIDLVVLDIALGEDSGLDLLPNLHGSAGNAIPVIIFSTHGAGLPSDERVQTTLSKMNSSLENLAQEVHDRLALPSPQVTKEVA